MEALWLLGGLVGGLALGFVIGLLVGSRGSEPMELPTVIEDPEPEELRAQWTPRMSPESYLRRLPNGPFAEQARRIVGRGHPAPAGGNLNRSPEL